MKTSTRYIASTFCEVAFWMVLMSSSSGPWPATSERKGWAMVGSSITSGSWKDRS